MDVPIEIILVYYFVGSSSLPSSLSLSHADDGVPEDKMIADAKTETETELKKSTPIDRYKRLRRELKLLTEDLGGALQPLVPTDNSDRNNNSNSSNNKISGVNGFGGGGDGIRSPPPERVSLRPRSKRQNQILIDEARKKSVVEEEAALTSRRSLGTRQKKMNKVTSPKEKIENKSLRNLAGRKRRKSFV